VIFKGLMMGLNKRSTLDTRRSARNQKERRIPRALILPRSHYANALSRDIVAQVGFIRLYQAVFGPEFVRPAKEIVL
jgi:hypothetical protein